MAHMSAAGTTVPTWISHVGIHLAENVQLESKGGETWALTTGNQPKVFRVPQSNTSILLSHLSRDGCSMEELLRLIDEETGPLSVIEQISRLWRAGCLKQAVRTSDKTVAVLRTRGDSPLFPRTITAADRVTLTENGCVRRYGSSLIVESLDFGVAVEFQALEYSRVIPGLMEHTSPGQLARQLNLSEDVVTALISWLVAIGVVASNSSPEMDQHYGQWSFADRLLHARCREGRHLGGYGGTFPLQGKLFQFPPALRPARNSSRLPLPKLDMAAISGCNVPFTSVLEQRCSVREFSNKLLSMPEVGEFLYRAARVRSISKVGEIEYVSRPFPAAGSLHEIEFYVLVNRCDGIPPAFYRYDGFTHELEHVSDPSPETRRMAMDAAWSAAMRSEPPLLIVLAARFPRIYSKYESIAYSLVLKNVGVVYQTMYLVATAMGLGGCALGGGNSDGFCRIAGTNYWEESSVGEFILGKPAPEKGRS